MTADMLNPIEEGEEDVDYVEAYKNNISEVQNYLKSVLGDENPQAVFNADHLEDLFAAVHTNDFWDDLFTAMPANVTNKDMPDNVMQSLAADLSGVTLDQQAPLVPQTTEHIDPAKIFSKALNILPESWTQVTSCDEAKIASLSPAVIEQVGGFVQHPEFWQEITHMHLEAKGLEHIAEEAISVEPRPTDAQQKTEPSIPTPAPSTETKPPVPLTLLPPTPLTPSTLPSPLVPTPLPSTLPTAPPTPVPSASTPIPTPVLPTSTLLQDLEVVKGAPAPQITLSKTTASASAPLAQLAEHLAARAERGPDLVFSFGIFCIAITSILLVASSSSVQESPVLFRLLWALAFAINLVCVMLPGRLDRVMVDGQHVKPWASLFEASTYAFGLWGLLYTLDILLTAYVGCVGIPTKLFQTLVAYWLAANWLQGLWCFAFRPEFVQHMYIPTLLLASACVSFGLAQQAITRYILEQTDSYSWMARGVLYGFRLPFSMHAAWMAAATLLNFNSCVAVYPASGGIQSSAAHLSCYVALVLGVGVAVQTHDPVISGTLAFALQAVAVRGAEKVRTCGGGAPGPAGAVNKEVKLLSTRLESA